MEQLQTLVETLERQEAMKHDYVASSANLAYAGGRLIMTHAGQQIEFKPTEHFHSQMSEKIGIPKGYYDRMKGKALDLLDANVNHWLTTEGKNLLVRAFEPKEAGNENIARALLSDRYNMIDNMEVLMSTLETLKETGVIVEVERAEISETRMYLTVIAPEIETKAKEMLKHYSKAKVGTGVISGFVLKNSEVGCGAFEIAPRAMILACRNGLVMQKDAVRKIHIGGQLDELEFYKNTDVVNANRKLVKEQVKHAVKRFLSQKYLESLVDSFTELGNKEIEAPISGVLELVAKEYNITQDRKDNILKHFIKGGDTRRIGVVNAITEEVQDLADVDLKNDGEAITYSLLTNFSRIEAAAIKAERSAN